MGNVKVPLENQRNKQKAGIMTSGFNHAASGGGFYKVSSLTPKGSLGQSVNESEPHKVAVVDQFEENKNRK